jgi:hypothetical protein
MTKAQKRKLNKIADTTLMRLEALAGYALDPEIIVANVSMVDPFIVAAHANAVKRWLDRLIVAAARQAKGDQAPPGVATHSAEIIEFPIVYRHEE